MKRRHHPSGDPSPSARQAVPAPGPGSTKPALQAKASQALGHLPEKKRHRAPDAPPPIGTVYLLRFQDVAFRLRMSVNRAWKLQKVDPRFPKSIAPPTRSRGKDVDGQKLYRESDLARYVDQLTEERDAALRASA